MKRFWDTVICPVLDAARPKSIVEVGSDTGENTRNLLAFCEKNDAVLHVVDPLPKYDVPEWQERYGERLIFHRDLSLEALPRITGFDLVLLDGDHNWYTVYNELKLIERLCDERSQSFPLVILHDIFWPYARRDLYYDAATIPEAYRKPYRQGGMEQGTSELLQEGGLNPQMDKAAHEGGPRNGVLTAVEDFLEETNQPLDLVQVPGFHGLGILVPPSLKKNAELMKALETWALPEAVYQHIEHIEAAWLRGEIHRRDQQTRLNDLRVLRKKEADASDRRQLEKDKAVMQRRIERLKRNNARLKHRMDEMRRQLADITGSRSWRLLAVPRKVGLGISRLVTSRRG